MEGVGPRLSAIKMRRRNPFGVPAGPFAGGPALVQKSVVRSAGKGELVDVGAARRCPIFDVMDLAKVARHIAAGCRAAAVLRVEDDPLPGRGEPFGVVQRQGFALVED